MPCKSVNKIRFESFLRVGGVCFALLVFILAFLFAVLVPAFSCSEIADASFIPAYSISDCFSISQSVVADSIEFNAFCFWQDFDVWLDSCTVPSVLNQSFLTFYDASDDSRVADLLLTFDGEYSGSIFLRLFSSDNQSSYARYELFRFSPDYDADGNLPDINYLKYRIFSNTYCFGYDSSSLVYADYTSSVSHLEWVHFLVDGALHVCPDVSNTALIDELRFNNEALQTRVGFVPLVNLDSYSCVPVKNYSVHSDVVEVRYNDVVYGGYAYGCYSSNGNTSSRSYLCELALPKTISSDIRLTYDAMCMFDGLDIINYSLSDNVFVRITWSYYSVKDSLFESDYHDTMYVNASNFFNGVVDLGIKDDRRVNFISFDLCTRSAGTYYTLPLQSSEGASLHEGLFFSNFVVYYRGFDLDDIKDFYYNNGYSAGNSDGYSAGSIDGYDSGYSAGSTDGYDSGYAYGYNVGHATGLTDSGEYSFMSLLGAVFDAPIKALMGLFNFNVLGVDMTSFVSSLFALCVIVVIIKLALGGK